MADEENANLYRPEDSGDDSPLAAGKNRQALTWTASEFIDHQRGAGWYAGLFVVTAALSAAAYLLIKDKFAAAIIVILGIILAFYANHKPGQITYQLDTTGLQVGERPFRYSNFKSFGIVHEGPLSTITFYPLKRVALPISIFFEAKNEKRITDLIGDHLPLEDRGPDGFDRLTRRLKI